MPAAIGVCDDSTGVAPNDEREGRRFYFFDLPSGRTSTAGDKAARRGGAAHSRDLVQTTFPVAHVHRKGFFDAPLAG